MQQQYTSQPLWTQTGNGTCSPTGKPRTMPSKTMTSATARMDSSVSSSNFLDFLFAKMTRRLGSRMSAAEVQSMLAVNSSHTGRALV